MPSRLIPLVTDEYYHIFNRGVAGMPVFNHPSDYKRFLATAVYYQVQGPKPRFSLHLPKTSPVDGKPKIVELICYCLMPNHFHFLLQQKEDGAITEFISKLTNSYTKYFNIKNHRVGPLFQGEFKAVHIDNDYQMLHLSRYIHLNPVVNFITKDLEAYQWSSFPEYIDKSRNHLTSKNIIMDQFESPKTYGEFCSDQEEYGKQLEMIKHNLIDYDYTPGV